MTIECIKFRKYEKGTLQGFADLFVPKWGVEIYGFSLHEKNGKRWINFPSKEYEKDGEKKHVSYFRFRDAKHYNLFCNMAKDAIEKKIQLDTKEYHHESTTDSEVCF